MGKLFFQTMKWAAVKIPCHVIFFLYKTSSYFFLFFFFFFVIKSIQQMPTQITQFPCSGERGQFKQTTIEAPALKGTEILIKILASGVCHTDCTFMGPDGLVLGHEAVGRVVEAGPDVKRVQVGDVVGTSYLKEACLSCDACTSGEDTLCDTRKMFPEGNSNGFASHQVADSR